jgi:cell division transport system permease protein
VNVKAWLTHHLHSLKIAARRFRDAPLATLFTILVIGAAVALPSGLFVLLSNLDRAAGGVKPQVELTLFIKSDIPESETRALATSLGKDADIAQVVFVSKAEGIKKLEAAGLSDITAGLPENPLPDTLIITPKDSSPTALTALNNRLESLQTTQRIVMDTDWIKRLSALMGLGKNLVFLLAALFGLALAAITANTIRLQIYAQQDEIEVAQLIGATDRFIRRPFLYFGGIQGLIGGVAGWAIVMLGGYFIENSVAQVAAAYGANFSLNGLGPDELILLLGLSTLLGWLGAYFSVNQALRQFAST